MLRYLTAFLIALFAATAAMGQAPKNSPAKRLCFDNELLIEYMKAQGFKIGGYGDVANGKMIMMYNFTKNELAGINLTENSSCLVFVIKNVNGRT